MEVILLWLVCAIIGGIIGSKKSRAAEGAAIGFFLGPIGVLISIFMADKGPKCPKCGGTIAKGVVKCMHCGSDL